MNTYHLLAGAVAFALFGVGFFTLAAAVSCIAEAWSRRRYTKRDTGL